jgi:hypothetical protein
MGGKLVSQQQTGEKPSPYAKMTALPTKSETSIGPIVGILARASWFQNTRPFDLATIRMDRVVSNRIGAIKMILKIGFPRYICKFEIKRPQLLQFFLVLLWTEICSALCDCRAVAGLSCGQAELLLRCND